jgi:hypothetical protein
METEPQKTFEDLTREERNLLRKEFGRCVETRFKVFLWSGIGLLLLTLISGGFSIYYMLNMLFTGVAAFKLYYICAAIFTVGCGGSMLLTSQYHKRFRAWLKEYKNIVNTPKNKQNLTRNAARPLKK